MPYARSAPSVPSRARGAEPVAVPVDLVLHGGPPVAGRRVRLRIVAVLAVLATLAAARAQPVAYVVAPARSTVHVVTGRAGALGFLGHEHAVLATAWSARLCYDPAVPAASSVRVVVPTAGLVIDAPAALAAAGLGSRPDDATVETLQARMLGPEFLDALSHPELRFESRAVTGEGSDLVVEGALTVHGVTRALTLPVRVTREPDGTTRFRAEARPRMTDHGIEPERTLGLVEVADAFRLVVELVARPGTAACSGAAAPGPRRRGDAP